MEPKAGQRLTNNTELFDDIELIMIVNAKKAGLSLGELNEFRICDYVKFMEIYTGEIKNKPKRATQDDIDRLLS